jgi:phage gpG-like protein
MFTIQVDSRAVTARLESMPARIHARLEQTVYALAERLRSHVIQDKLLGQVLNRRTGRLGQSIQQKVDSTATGITGTVYSAGDVKYAAIHEFGGHIPGHEIVARNAQALAFMMGGKQVFAKRVNWPGATMPERSFMRSSLADMRDEIVEKMTQAVQDGAKE